METIIKELKLVRDTETVVISVFNNYFNTGYKPQALTRLNEFLDSAIDNELDLRFYLAEVHEDINRIYDKDKERTDLDEIELSILTDIEKVLVKGLR